jgi:hypothetical protein
VAGINAAEVRAMAGLVDELDYYQLLEIPRDAPASAVKRAYHGRRGACTGRQPQPAGASAPARERGAPRVQGLPGAARRTRARPTTRSSRPAQGPHPARRGGGAADERRSTTTRGARRTGGASSIWRAARSTAASCPARSATCAWRSPSSPKRLLQEEARRSDAAAPALTALSLEPARRQPTGSQHLAAVSARAVREECIRHG